MTLDCKEHWQCFLQYVIDFAHNIIITFDDYTKLINLTYEKTDYDNILYTVILAVIIAVISSAVIRKGI